MELATLQNQAKSLDMAQLREITVQGKSEPDTQNFAVYNLQKHSVASFVKPGYNIVQHHEVIEAVTDVLQNLGAKCNAHMVNNGNKVYADIEFSDAKLNISKGEEFIAGLRIVNSYDKTTGIAIVPRLVRCVCDNGMVVTKTWVKGYTIKHTKKLKEDFLVTVQRLMKNMINGSEKLKGIINNCMEDSIEYETMQLILEKLATSKKKMHELCAILESDNGFKDRYTRWEMYNAITNYITHGAQLAPSMEDHFERMSEKVLKTQLSKLPKIEVVSK